MATLPDLTSFDHWHTETSTPGSDAATLTLPIRGKEYTWRAGDLSTWAMLTLRRLDEKAREIADKMARDEPVDEIEIALTTAEQKRLDLDLLGDNLQRMSDDGVKWAETVHASATLLSWYLRGHNAAMATWARKDQETPPDPPARAASTKTAGSSTRKTTKARSAGRTSSTTGASSRRTSTASTKSTSPAKKSAAATRRAGS